MTKIITLIYQLYFDTLLNLWFTDSLTHKVQTAVFVEAEARCMFYSRWSCDPPWKYVNAGVARLTNYRMITNTVTITHGTPSYL